MKVKKIEVKPEFKPIAIQLTFESKIEYEVFKEMMRRNIKLPEIMFEHETNKSVALGGILEEIFNALIE